MTSIVVAAALAAANGAHTDPAVVPAGFMPGGGGAWSGTTTFYGGVGRQANNGAWLGPEALNPPPPGFGRDGRRFGSPYSPSPYDQPPRRLGGGAVGGGVYIGGWTGGGVGGVGGGGLFRRR